MKWKFDIKSLTLGAIVGATVIHSVASATSDRAAMEYKTLSVTPRAGDMDRQINELALEGWEVVSCTFSDTAQMMLVICKRLKSA